LVELVEVAAAKDSPKVASVIVVGDGRRGKAAAVAMQITRGARERKRGASEGWAGSVKPTQTRAGRLSQARWAGWAGRPIEPAGQMGQFGLGKWL
jgi:hypothetical protein